MVTARDSSGDQSLGVGERMLSQLLQEMDGLQARVIPSCYHNEAVFGLALLACFWSMSSPDSSAPTLCERSPEPA